MTISDFKQALKEGKTDVIYTDIDGKTYIHTILKAGKKQANIMNNFLNKEYKLSYWQGDYPQYKIK